MNKKIYFRAGNKNVEKVFEPPKPSKNFIPKWYKKMSNYIVDNNAPIFFDGNSNHTVKMCPPFLDSMTSGYTITLPADVYFANTKEYKYRANWSVNWKVITTHIHEQMPGLEIQEEFEPDPLKWEGGWEIITPKGYSALIVHPLNRFDLPFITMSGLVDSDVFHRPVNIPFFIRKDFVGIIEAGTPIAQVIPIKREVWDSSILKYNEDESAYSTNKLKVKMERSYKKMFWQKKEYN